MESEQKNDQCPGKDVKDACERVAALAAWKDMLDAIIQAREHVKLATNSCAQGDALNASAQLVSTTAALRNAANGYNPMSRLGRAECAGLATFEETLKLLFVHQDETTKRTYISAANDSLEKLLTDDSDQHSHAHRRVHTQAQRRLEELLNLCERLYKEINEAMKSRKCLRPLAESLDRDLKRFR